MVVLVEMEDTPLPLDVDSPKEEMPLLVMAEGKMALLLLQMCDVICA